MLLKKLYVYASIIVLFVIETLLFMLYNWTTYSQYGLTDWLAVIYHSLPHDITIAGYIMVLPLLLSLVHIWRKGTWHDTFMRRYLSVVLPLLPLLWLIDLILYSYWGYRLDATPVVYFLDSPWLCVSQIKWWEALITIPTAILVIYATHRYSRSLYPSKKPIPSTHGGNKGRAAGSRRGGVGTVSSSFLILILLTCLIISIRGGVGVATMNIGRAYFSSETALNHAAVNPVFSFIYSLTKQSDITTQYHFMDDSEAEAAYEELMSMGSQCPDTTAIDECVLTTQRPNIVIVILESFSGYMCPPVWKDADPRIMPCFTRLYDEGIAFTNMYCNAWRTDRGVGAILAAYPAQPAYAVMKIQEKCDKMQFITKRLKEYGYDLQFLHGGDVNFTNMNGFLMAGGIEDIISENSFPAADRAAKWGVPDHITFNRLFDEIQSHKGTKPFCKVMLTLSSHEPFDVPYHKLADEFDNSVAYTDSCLGNFIDRLRDTPQWKNTLVIAVPDHSSGHPELFAHADPNRFRIPMVWTGGAISKPQRVSTIAQQTDIAATLFSQMNIRHDDFIFSKNIFDPHQSHFAFYAFSDGLALITDSIRYIQDNERDGVGLYTTHDPHGRAQRWGKAYLQFLCKNLNEL